MFVLARDDIFSSISPLEVGVEVEVGLERLCVILVHVADDSGLCGRPFAGLRGVRVGRHRAGRKR